MLSLALKDKKNFSLSDYELTNPAPGFTIHTVRHFKDLYGTGHSICWLLGADSIAELPRWYKITELIDECNLCTMYRAGFAAPCFSQFEGMWGRQRVEKLGKNVIKTPLVDINSTEIRNAIAAGQDISSVLAPAVADYIRRHGLYKS